MRTGWLQVTETRTRPIPVWRRNGRGSEGGWERPHDHATVPSPEGHLVARTERSPGFGPNARLPGSNPVARRAVEEHLPVTVAGPRRICTGFRVAPFAWSTCEQGKHRSPLPSGQVMDRYVLGGGAASGMGRSSLRSLAKQEEWCWQDRVSCGPIPDAVHPPGPRPHIVGRASATRSVRETPGHDSRDGGSAGPPHDAGAQPAGATLRLCAGVPSVWPISTAAPTPRSAQAAPTPADRRYPGSRCARFPHRPSRSSA
jgi:hypothetical protein